MERGQRQHRATDLIAAYRADLSGHDCSGSLRSVGRRAPGFFMRPMQWNDALDEAT